MARVASLCTGVGGLDLGAALAYTAAGGTAEHLWYSEIDPGACAVLATRLPGVPNIGDLTTADWASLPAPDLLAAGFPCQPVSSAGQQKAQDDSRWLWPHVLTAIRVLRPQEVLLENVRNLVSIQKGHVFGQILAGLRDAGYAARWAIAGACTIGSCHHRHRVFVIARHTGDRPAPPAEQITVDACGARRGKARKLLPTPRATDTGTPGRRASTGYRPPLSQVIREEQLLLPTPIATDGQGGTRPVPPVRSHAGLDHGPRLRDVAAALHGPLLPTPRASDAANGGPNQHGGRGIHDLMLPSAVIGDRYGRYSDAVDLWQHLSGLPAPAPTMLNAAGQWRLDPRLPEWMLGFPPGWITGVVDRLPALRLAGNAVVAQLVAALYPIITAGWAHPGPTPAPAPPAPAPPALQPGRRAQLALL